MFKVPLVDLSVGAIAYILPWYLFESSCHGALEAGDVPAASDRPELGADRRLERVHGRRRDLDDDGGD